MDKRQTFSLWYLFIALIVLVAIQDLVRATHTVTLIYSEFKQALAANKLEDIVIADGEASGKLKADGLEQILPKDKVEALRKSGDDHSFQTALVNDPGLVAQLDAAKVRYGTVRESKWLGALISWVAPALVFFLIWTVLMKRMGGAGHGGLLEIGKSKARGAEQRQFSEETAKAIDDEVASILAAAKSRVETTLTEHRATLETLAKLLLDKEVVDRQMLDSVIHLPAFALVQQARAASSPPYTERVSPLRHIHLHTATRRLI